MSTTSENLKLATWNVGKPVNALRRLAIRDFIDDQNADLWVLTEAHDGFDPGFAFSCSSVSGRDGNHLPAHRWVTIWSDMSMSRLQTSDLVRTCAVRVKPGTGKPFIVYGTVLPWRGSAWRDHAGSGGTAFREALALQTLDWTRLQNEFPADEFFVLGDFNQELVAPRYTGTNLNRRELELALQRGGLVALTAGEADPVRKDLSSACIDHICARQKSEWSVVSTSRWPESMVPKKGPSDHYGISVSLSRSGALSAAASESSSTDCAMQLD